MQPNEIVSFDNPEFGQVRAVEVDGKAMFCGKDVAKALGYSKPNNALDRHCKGPRFGDPLKPQVAPRKHASSPSLTFTD